MAASPDDKFALQDEQYHFPYHHIPHFHGDHPSTVRRLGWGLEYLCYLRILVERVRAIAPASLLDVGCGDGRFLGLIGAGVARRKGVDLSTSAIGFARAFHPEVQFEAIDAADLTEQFDAVTSIETLEHVPDDAVGGFLRTLAARSRDHVLISVPTTAVPLNKKHYRHYDLELLERQVAASGAPLALAGHEFIYRGSRLMTALRWATANRLWTLEIAAVQDLAWRYVWTRLRTATARDGHHLLAHYRRR
jgi:cyclopropane fatty-acyl-phospholipid synthase-like methyltransferase